MRFPVTEPLSGGSEMPAGAFTLVYAEENGAVRAVLMREETPLLCVDAFRGGAERLCALLSELVHPV